MAVTAGGLAQWCWHRLPPGLRQWLYRTSVLVRIDGPDPTTEWTANWKNRPWYVRVLGFGYRLTLWNYRITAKKFWPEIGQLDLFISTLTLFALRFHSVGMAWIWGNAHRLRRHRRPRAVAGAPLRVMHVTSSFDIGGTQRQIKNLCIAGTTRFEHTTTEIFPEMNFMYRQRVGLERERYVSGGLLRRALGRCVISIGTRSPQLIQAYKLIRDFTAYRPDVVVGWGHEMCVTTFVAAAVARVPHIVFCIRTFNPAYGWADAEMGRLLGIAHRRMTPCVTAVITNSTPLCEDHARWLGIGEDAVKVCANGIDPLQLNPGDALARRAALRRQLGIDEGTFVVTNVGRFSAEKGQMSIVAVNQRMQHDYAGRLLWLLGGDGPTLDSVRTAAAGMTNIQFLGRITAVYDHLCASDAFVMPSDFEGMPNAMMEAMACGLPCVSTDRSGAVDVARHGCEALFYKVGDLAAMEQHIRFLLDHPDDARAMGRRAQARLAEFSPERSIERFEQILERAVPNSPMTGTR